MSPAYQTLKRFVLSRSVGFRDHRCSITAREMSRWRTDEHGNVKPVKKKSRGESTESPPCNALALVLLDPIPKPKKTLAKMLAQHEGFPEWLNQS